MRVYGQFREGGYGRFSRAEIETAVKDSTSFTGVLLRLGMNPRVGSAHSALKRRILSNGIDTSHFLSPYQRAKGKTSPRRRSPSQILTLKLPGSRKEQSTVRRRALLELGTPEKCVDCGCGTFWNGKPIQLQVDHVNGNSLDDRSENLAFRCPNCHSQTPTFGNKKRASSGAVAHWQEHPARTRTYAERCIGSSTLPRSV